MTQGDTPSLSDPGPPLGVVLQTPTVAADTAVPIDRFKASLATEDVAAASIIRAVEQVEVESLAKHVAWSQAPCRDGTRSLLNCEDIGLAQGTMVQTLIFDGTQYREDQALEEFGQQLVREPRLIQAARSDANGGRLYLEFALGAATNDSSVKSLVLALESQGPSKVVEVFRLAGGYLGWLARERSQYMDEEFRIVATSEDAEWIDRAQHEADLRCRHVPPGETQNCNSQVEWPNGTWPSRDNE